MSTGNPRFLALLDKLRSMHQQKSADYGSDTDPLANFRGATDAGVEPWLAAWVRAKDKVKRIDRYCCKRELANEGVADSLLDLAAYCLIVLVLYEEATETNPT